MGVVRGRAGGLVAAAALMLAAAGCGVTTSETAFSDELVAQVGAGSVALRDADRAVSGALAGPAKTTKRSELTSARLFDGRLSEMSMKDIGHLIDVTETNVQDMRGTADDLAASQRALRAAAIDPDEHEGLSAGAREFVGVWNGYLGAHAARGRGMQDAMGKFTVAYGQLVDVMQAALDVDDVSSRRRYDRLRRSVRADVLSMAGRLRAQLTAFAKPGPRDKALTDLLNDSTQARAIFAAVNDEFPDGYLAGFRRGG